MPSHTVGKRGTIVIARRARRAINGQGTPRLSDNLSRKITEMAGFYETLSSLEVMVISGAYERDNQAVT